MVTVFVGQRGTGKSTLLKRIDYYLKESHALSYRWVDLDSEIEEKEGKPITTIFKDKGESYFREKEVFYFKKIMELARLQKDFHYIVAVGGGFPVSELEVNEFQNKNENKKSINELKSEFRIKIVYIQRTSEKLGRIFLDRPPLDINKTPLEEFFYRKNQRHPLFLKAAWEEYIIPEGLEGPSAIEKKILLGEIENVGGVLTLLPHYFSSASKWNYFIQRRLKWGVNFFEVRDDLLSLDQIRLAQKDIPLESLLYSRRLLESPLSAFESEFLNIDYDRERILPQTDIKIGRGLRILSVHFYKENESLTELLKDLEPFERQGFHIKLAVEIKGFNELKRAHDWQLQSPDQRSFLPRSKNGRWLWYRLWMGNRQRLNFWREGEGSAVDQPSLYQWLHRSEVNSGGERFNETGFKFAALLGSPVEHSYTPVYQGEYFKKWKIPVFPIAVEDSEFEEALLFLEEIGLKAAAVTSPLKLKAYKKCLIKTSKAEEHHSVNTLFLKSRGVWSGHNTDEEGLEFLLKEFERVSGEPLLYAKKCVAVWGGGGTLPLLKKLLPEAEYYSVQSGALREPPLLSKGDPVIVIWASGRFQEEGGKAVPSCWKPSYVIDLNYREDSGGRELALKSNSKYFSGLSMFYKQAEGQRKFWDEALSME